MSHKQLILGPKQWAASRASRSRDTLESARCARQTCGAALPPCTQANRDSARRSKMRKKKENEDMVVKSKQLQDTHDTLARQLTAGTERVRQLRNLNYDLRQQLAGYGVQL